MKILHCFVFVTGVKSITCLMQCRTFEFEWLSLHACSNNFRWSLVVLRWLWKISRQACKHSDDLALPQQSSPNSYRSKHSNNVCSSLRRHPVSVSFAFADVAHEFWHFNVFANGQHNLPDQSLARATATIRK